MSPKVVKENPTLPGTLDSGNPVQRIGFSLFSLPNCNDFVAYRFEMLQNTARLDSVAPLNLKKKMSGKQEKIITQTPGQNYHVFPVRPSPFQGQRGTWTQLRSTEYSYETSELKFDSRAHITLDVTRLSVDINCISLYQSAEPKSLYFKKKLNPYPWDMFSKAARLSAVCKVIRFGSQVWAPSSHRSPLTAWLG